MATVWPDKTSRGKRHSNRALLDGIERKRRRKKRTKKSKRQNAFEIFLVEALGFETSFPLASSVARQLPFPS